MTRQNYYARRKLRRRREVDAQLVAALVKRERCVQPRLGGRKLQVVLREELADAGVRMGRDRFFEVLRRQDLLLKRQRTDRPRTTQSYHTLPKFTNRIKGLAVSRPNQVWVGDLTYLRTEEGFMFLAMLTDKMSRQIVGYHCADSLESMGCQAALKKALKQLPQGAQVIHHSDRGSQYCCHEYVELAQSAGLIMSMTEVDHCAENALAERMNGILKGEYGLDRCFKTKAQSRTAVEQAIHLYGTRRPHSSLGMRYPSEVHALAPQSPLHPPAGCPATGTQAHDMSRELAFKDRLISALPQSPTIPSSRFADS